MRLRSLLEDPWDSSCTECYRLSWPIHLMADGGTLWPSCLDLVSKGLAVLILRDLHEYHVVIRSVLNAV